MVILNIVFLLLAIAMVAVILVQRGPGATAGAAFGSGASGTVFGARGSASFLTKLTAILATLFCAVSLVMGIMAARTVETAQEPSLGVVDQVTTTQQSEEPAAAADSEVPVVSDDAAIEAADDVPVVNDTQADAAEADDTGAVDDTDPQQD